jgi:hypothetical protein
MSGTKFFLLVPFRHFTLAPFLKEEFTSSLVSALLESKAGEPEGLSALGVAESVPISPRRRPKHLRTN